VFERLLIKQYTEEGFRILLEKSKDIIDKLTGGTKRAVLERGTIAILQRGKTFPRSISVKSWYNFLTKTRVKDDIAALVNLLTDNGKNRRVLTDTIADIKANRIEGGSAAIKVLEQFV
jgi:hypothetical protein